MTPLQTGLLVLGILVANLLVFVPLLMWVRRRTAQMVSELQRELAASGERVLAGPCRAVYRGGTSGYSKVKGNGVAALTDRRLIIRKMFGETS